MNSAAVAWTNLDTGMDITIAAQVGDTLEASLSALVGSETVSAYFDVVTIVSATPVNSFGKRGAVETAAGFYIIGWFCSNGVFTPLGAPVHYTVVAGDLVSGLVTLRLRYATSAATNKTFYASGTTHIAEFCVSNRGPVDGT